MIKCKHCERSFKHDEALNDHLWKQHPEVKLPAKYAEKKMTEAYDLAYHKAKKAGASEGKAQEAGMIAFGDFV